MDSRAWEELHSSLSTASEDQKGRTFELLVQAYLKLDSKYDFTDVWSTHGEVPKRVLTRLNLFGRDVTGIDLVAATARGRYWAVQCKYHQDEKWSLSRKEATGLIAGRNRAHTEFELGLICTTANGRSANLANEPDLEYLMGDVWRGLGPEFFERLHALLKGAIPPPPPLKQPRLHQHEALAAIVPYFANHSRGKVVMPCATGKSLIGFWSAEKLGARRVLVAVPNLSLVRQLLKDWTEQSLAHGRRPRWVVVCSDDSVADSVAAKDLGVKVDTDAQEVAGWLRSHQDADLSVVFTTYQSGRVLAEAARQAGAVFDLGIFDEAHRTAGREGTQFAHLLSDDNVRVHKRLYMTATPRMFKGKDRNDIISMDDPVLYGGDAFRMPFLGAMDRGIIPNLTIVAVTVGQTEVEALLRDRRFVRLKAEHKDEVVRAEDLVSALALRKAMTKYGIRRTLGFYSSRKRCRLSGEVQGIIEKLVPEYGTLAVSHVDGDMTAAERDAELRDFEHSSSALLTNVRVFVEGVDCPSMDAVIFADPRQSSIDIVQGIGRALRPFDGKVSGYAIIPTIIEDDGTPSDEAYEQVVRIACALGSENEVIVDYFAAIAQGKPWMGRRVFEVLGDVDVGVRVDLEKVNQAIAVRTYERTVDWMPFAEARELVRGLGLKNQRGWAAYAKSPQRPASVPADPYAAYRGKGWNGLGDWLGTGVLATRQRRYRPFADARDFVRRLGLKGQAQWIDYTKSVLAPRDIPACPNAVYAQDGWAGYGDWLGTGRRHGRGWRRFKEARDFVHQLRFATLEEWKKYARSGAIPPDIPANPWQAYEEQGWSGVGDWLGTFRRSGWKPFIEAHRFVSRLGLKRWKEWIAYCKSGKKPADIPSSPERVYAGKGWRGFGDWLGSGRQRGGWRPFTDARKFVRRLHIDGHDAWFAYGRSGKKPTDIPLTPWRAYRDQGWTNFSDWIGSGRPRGGGWRGFDEARTFVHRLDLENAAGWRKWSKSKERPDDIPSNPHVAYQNSGWISWTDWLGTGKQARRPDLNP